MSVFAPGYAARYGAAALAGFTLIRLAGRARLGRPDALALAIVTWVLASQFWAVDQDTSWSSLKDVVGALVLFMAVRLIIETRTQLRLVALSYLGGCVWAVYQLATQDSVSEAGAALSDAPVRGTIEGVNANYLAYALSVGIVMVVLAWSLKRPALLGRLATYALVAAIYGLGVLQTGTRGALVGLVFLAGWFVLCRVRRPRTLGLAWVVMLAAVLTVASGVLDNQIRSRLTVSNRETGTLNGRLDSWPAARELFLDHPIFGTGIDGFIYMNRGIAAHNAVLDLGAGLGIVGIALFAWCFGTAIGVASRGADRRVRVLVIGGFLTVTAPILASGYWHQSPAFWLAVGMLSKLAVALPESARPEPPADAASKRSPAPRAPRSRTGVQ